METLIILPIVLFSIIIHEISHGYAALLLGDTTARDAGRLTLNPLRHFDFMGTILILLTMVGLFPFGYAKPVPVDPRRLRKPGDMLYVALAGPGSNFALLVIFCLLLRGYHAVYYPLDGADLIAHILLRGAGLNVVLMLFNLIPLLPLDGGRIIYELLPGRLKWKFGQTERWGMFALLLILVSDSYFNLNLLGPILFYPAQIIISLLTGFQFG